MATAAFEQILDTLVAHLRENLADKLTLFDAGTIAEADIQPKARKLSANDAVFINYAGTEVEPPTTHRVDATFPYVIEILRFDPDPDMAQRLCGRTEVAVRMLLRPPERFDLTGLSFKRIRFQPSRVAPGRTMDGRMGSFLQMPIRIEARISSPTFYV